MSMANTTQIAFRIPNDLLVELKRVAIHEDRTVSNLLNRIVRQYLTSCAAQEARERVLAEGEGE